MNDNLTTKNMTRGVDLIGTSGGLLDALQLQRFLAVFELRNFARAAEATSITQQAMSKSIARLEQQLGITLFERGAFGAEPTEFGKALAKRAKIIVTESRLAQAELNALKGAVGGVVRVGFGWSFLPRIAPLVITRFRRRRPNVIVSVVSGQSASLFKKLTAGELEFVASAPSRSIQVDEAIEMTELFYDSDVMVVRADHPLANKPIVALQELSDQTWITSLAQGGQWREISEIFISAGCAPPQNIIDMDTLILCKSLLFTSDCIAILGREQVARELERGDLKAMERPEFQFRRRGYYSVRRNAVAQPAALAFKKDLIEVCREFYA